MSPKPKRKALNTNAGAATKPPVADASSPAISSNVDVATEANGTSSQKQMPEGMFARMQALISERIDQTRDTLRANEEAFVRLVEYETRISQLEKEVRRLQEINKTLEIRTNQMSAENSVFHNRMNSLESSKTAAESKVAVLRQVIERLHTVAGEEIGRVAKALLPARKRGFLSNGVSLSRQAKMLVDANVVDPDWYLKRHSDVADVGMEAAVHYVLHGADEGRVSRPALDHAAEEK